MILIGLCGKKNSGKDTCADYIVSKYHFTKYQFAKPLKEICKIMFMISDEQLTNRTLKEQVDVRWGISPREMFQIVGTDFVRNHIDEDFWIKHFKYWIDNLNKYCDDYSNSRIVVSDVRFQNELDMIKSLGGIIIKIERPSQIDDSHISETGIDNLTNYDFGIRNDSTKDILLIKLEEIISSHLMRL